ncbi:unnamed protein product [Ilex paraguariensis]|uniref:glycerophosphodiester phosphodiesterase n=1 Tax=Ilex paraguariensis TaxID=185542 RepID=A0ABC8TZY3_9AQUA
MLFLVAACLAQNKNASKTMKGLVLSHNRAGGDYPSITDLAYQKAIDDGADIIDCFVQMTKMEFSTAWRRPPLQGKLL